LSQAFLQFGEGRDLDVQRPQADEQAVAAAAHVPDVGRRGIGRGQQCEQGVKDHDPAPAVRHKEKNFK